MKLNSSERSFVEKRRRLIGLWPWVGGAMLAALALGVAALWVYAPLLSNPWAVFAALRTGTVPDGTLMLMAAILPVAILTCAAVLAALILLLFAAASNERRLIRIIVRCIRVDTENDRP